ncbi:hypothetical protein HXK74_01820 [Candidatus Gracilibacteria bacterium]|nr:hypothetical protein [Candidatus Gracilibacteria bacterium]
MVAIEQLKSEISEKYLDDFKEQLGFLKSLVLLPIKDDIKKILSGEANLPQKFDEVKEFGWWKNIINFVTPDIANQIFTFMKEKRTEIETRKTEEELQALKNEVLTGIKIQGKETPQTLASNLSSNQENMQADLQAGDVAGDPLQKSDPQFLSYDKKEKHTQESEKESPAKSMAMGVAAGAAGVGATLGLDRVIRGYETRNLVKKLSPEQIKEQLNGALETMKKQRNSLESRLSSKQLKVLDKNIDKLSKGFANFDKETIDLLKSWDSLGGKIPNKILFHLGLDPKTLKQISLLSDQLIGKSPADIQTILKSNNILDVGDDLVESFSKAASKAELESMCTLLSRGTKLNRAIKTFKGAMLFDMACLGFDVYVYLEDNKEADLIAKVNEMRASNKYTRANVQLGIGVVSVAIEALLMCTSLGSAGGPIGALIGAGVGGLTAAAAIGVDTLYFDVKDFYLQNKEDFLRQKRSQLNQTILQGLYNKENGNTTLNEKLGAPELTQKAKSLNDAIWSMLFIDELENGDLGGSSQVLFSYLQSGKKKADFESGLSQQERQRFDLERKQIEEKVKQRFDYLKTFFESGDVVRKIEKGGGMQYLDNLVNQSRVYQTLKSQNKWNTNLNFNQNLDLYQKEYFKDVNPEKVKKLQNLEKINPELYQEILVTSDLSSLLSADEEDQNYTENVKLVKAMQDWKRLITGDRLVRLQIPDSNKNVAFIENLLRKDFDLSQTHYPQLGKEDVATIVENRQERRGNLNVSDDPMQNVLYRLACELYGYTGENDKAQLMQFYSEDVANNHGIYFSSERKLNKDWLIDGGIDTRLVSGFPASQLDVKVDQIMKKEFKTSTSSIDTPTENIDANLQKEFESKLRSILKSELSYRTVEKQNEIKNQISAFVSKNAQGGKYIELPYYLLLQAKKAGFGDLQRQFFTMKNGKLETLTLKSELNDKKVFNAEVSYLSPQREKFSDEEQALIARVEVVHQQLSQLQAVESSFSKEDELDMPKEIEVLIADKYKEREKFKTDILYYDASVVGTSEILKQYESFATYFENLYLGIMLSLTKFKTNDVDSFALYNAALFYGEGDFFSADGTFDEKKITSFPYLQNAKVKDYYLSSIKTQKVGSKTIEQLRKSEDAKEKEIGHQASKLILSTMISESLLGKNSDGKIITIKVGGNWGDTDAISALLNPNKLSEKIKKRLLKLPNIPVLDTQKIQKLKESPVRVKVMPNSQKEAIKQINPLQGQIEATSPNIVWQNQRGNIIYDPERAVLKSWGHTIKLAEKSGKFYLDKLDLGLSLKEALRLANFANWIKKTYKRVRIAFEIEGLHDALVAKNQGMFGSDTEIISQDTLKERCPIAKDDAVVKKIASWLTEMIK